MSIPDQAVYMAACHFYLADQLSNREDPWATPELNSLDQERGIIRAARFAQALREEVERTIPAPGNARPSPRKRMVLSPVPDPIQIGG